MTDRPLRPWDQLTVNEKNELYAQTERLLRLARAELPYPLAPAPTPRLPFTPPTIEQTLDDVELYLNVGENGDAWELLAIVAKEVGGSAAFWQYLREAALLMRSTTMQDEADAQIALRKRTSV